jgi:hypothetical protein
MANKQKQKAQELLVSYGKNIDKGELKQFEKKFDIQKAKDFAKETGGVSLGKNAKTYFSTGGAAGAQQRADEAAQAEKDKNQVNTDIVFDPGDGGGPRTMSQSTYDYEYASGLVNLENDTRKQLEILRGASAEKIADISAGAQRYGYDADERARKYVADRAGQSAEAVENIRAKGNIDLQAIVNAGLKDVAEIQGLTSRDVEKTRGEYGVKQEETRQAGSRDIARIGGKAGIYQGLMGAFNF